MPASKRHEEKLDLYLKYFVQWKNKFTILVFFVIFLVLAVLALNYFILISVIPSLYYAPELSTIMIALAAFSIVLVFAFQVKKSDLEKKLFK